jgi:hypothetical protein
MRVGIVRNDLGQGVYLADLSSRNQYPYASAVRGQARTLRKPVDSELLSVIKANPLPVAVTGLNTSTAVDTRLATGLSVRASRGATFTTIPVSATGALLKTDISAQLNSGFASAGLPLAASVVSPNELRIQSVAKGPGAYVEVNSQGSAGYSGSLAFVTGLAGGPVVAPAPSALLAALKTAVYTGAIFNVGTAAVQAAGVTVNTGANINFGLLGTGSAQFVSSVAELVAPKLLETGDVLLSFAKGDMADLRKPTYVLHGVTGAAMYATDDGGATAYTYPQ